MQFYRQNFRDMLMLLRTSMLQQPNVNYMQVHKAHELKLCKPGNNKLKPATVKLTIHHHVVQKLKVCSSTFCCSCMISRTVLQKHCMGKCKWHIEVDLDQCNKMYYLLYEVVTTKMEVLNVRASNQFCCIKYVVVESKLF